MANENRIDWREYPEGPQRWAMLMGRSPEAIFRTWGAVEIVWLGKPDRGYLGQALSTYYALKMNDGMWRIASTDGGNSSIGCDEKVVFAADTGWEAWFKHEAHILVGHVRWKTQQLGSAISALRAEAHHINGTGAFQHKLVPAMLEELQEMWRAAVQLARDFGVGYKTLGPLAPLSFGQQELLNRVEEGQLNDNEGAQGRS